MFSLALIYWRKDKVLNTFTPIGIIYSIISGYLQAGMEKAVLTAIAIILCNIVSIAMDKRNF